MTAPTDEMLQAFLARRRLSRLLGALLVEVVGTAGSAPAHALRDHLIERELPHVWFDADQPMGQALMKSAWLEPDDLPVVFAYGRTHRRVTPRRLELVLGLGVR